MSYRCVVCRYKEHTEFGEDCMDQCDLCWDCVCYCCLDDNKEKCGIPVCSDCCNERCYYIDAMDVVREEYMEILSKIRSIKRLKTLKEELMAATWKVERVEPWCGESWDID